MSGSKGRSVKISKYLGNDAYSWAVFVDGRPVLTGLGRSEAQHERDRLLEYYAKGKR